MRENYINNLSNSLKFALLIIFAGCSSTYSYIRADHPRAKGHLTEEVMLVYATEKAPEDATIIEHISQTERSTNCENATINALEKMQKAAIEKGGNALINLRAVWEKGKVLSNEKGFQCVKSKAVAMVAGPFVKMVGITWEGDIAKVGGETTSTEQQTTPPAE